MGVINNENTSRILNKNLYYILSKWKINGDIMSPFTKILDKFIIQIQNYVKPKRNLNKSETYLKKIQ